MTTLSDRCDQLLDLAAHALAIGRVDLVSVDDTAAIFQLATEVLEPAVSDLRRQLADAQASIVWLKHTNAELRDRQVVVLPGTQVVTNHIRSVVRAAKAGGL